jgi:acyl-CoA reductase-like NAD-dependent aldehyde dehydrogenase
MAEAKHYQALPARRISEALVTLCEIERLGSDAELKKRHNKSDWNAVEPKKKQDCLSRNRDGLVQRKEPLLALDSEEAGKVVISVDLVSQLVNEFQTTRKDLIGQQIEF